MLQPSFFDQSHDDLPLFSGTAPKGKVKPFAPKPKPKQDTIPVSCTACMDTGNIGGKSCWCKKGKTIMNGHDERCACHECEIKESRTHWGDGSLYDPTLRFKIIESGICPDCDGRLDHTGGCDDCHIVPALDPEYQVWIKDLIKS